MLEEGLGDKANGVCTHGTAAVTKRGGQPTFDRTAIEAARDLRCGEVAVLGQSVMRSTWRGWALAALVGPATAPPSSLALAAAPWVLSLSGDAVDRHRRSGLPFASCCRRVPSRARRLPLVNASCLTWAAHPAPARPEHLASTSMKTQTAPRIRPDPARCLAALHPLHITFPIPAHALPFLHRPPPQTTSPVPPALPTSSTPTTVPMPLPAARP